MQFDLTPRRCLREPIPQIFEAAAYLRAAVDAHAGGNPSAAASLFNAANMPAVWDWTDSIWGKHRTEILRIRMVADAPAKRGKEGREKIRMPVSQDQVKLIARHGYRCAFCSIPLIPKRVRQRAVKLYPEAVTWGRTNGTQHAAFQAMWLQFDHVLPHARGGDNSLDNLVVTCAPCNFGRMTYTLEEMGLIDPRSRPVEKTDWNGLIDFV